MADYDELFARNPIQATKQFLDQALKDGEASSTAEANGFSSQTRETDQKLFDVVEDHDLPPATASSQSSEFPFESSKSPRKKLPDIVPFEQLFQRRDEPIPPPNDVSPFTNERFSGNATNMDPASSNADDQLPRSAKGAGQPFLGTGARPKNKVDRSPFGRSPQPDDEATNVIDSDGSSPLERWSLDRMGRGSEIKLEDYETRTRPNFARRDSSDSDDGRPLSATAAMKKLQNSERNAFEAKIRNRYEEQAREHAKRAEAALVAAKAEAILAKAELEAHKASLQKRKSETIFFKDCLGRKFNFPYEKVRTWHGLMKVIEEPFRHVEPVGSQVREGRFDLIGDAGQILLPTLWEDMIEPGMQISQFMWPLDEDALNRQRKEAYEARKRGPLNNPKPIPHPPPPPPPPNPIIFGGGKGETTGANIEHPTRRRPANYVPSASPSVASSMSSASTSIRSASPRTPKPRYASTTAAQGPATLSVRSRTFITRFTSSLCIIVITSLLGGSATLCLGGAFILGLQESSSDYTPSPELPSRITSEFLYCASSGLWLILSVYMTLVPLLKHSQFPSAPYGKDGNVKERPGLWRWGCIWLSSFASFGMAVASVCLNRKEATKSSFLGGLGNASQVFVIFFSMLLVNEQGAREREREREERDLEKVQEDERRDWSD